MKKVYVVASLVIIAIIFAGCATIFKGTTQDIMIKSTPEKATVTIKTVAGVEMFSGTTPVSAKLSKKYAYIATIKVEGYKESMIQISQSLEGWFIGNLICGGIIGMIIDYANGAMWNLEPENITVTLVTAYLDGNETQIYAVFRAVDNDGQLRTMVVPLIKDTPLHASK
jgi:predicted small secreted protein